MLQGQGPPPAYLARPPSLPVPNFDASCSRATAHALHTWTDGQLLLVNPPFLGMHLHLPSTLHLHQPAPKHFPPLVQPAHHLPISRYSCYPTSTLNSTSTPFTSTFYFSICFHLCDPPTSCQSRERPYFSLSASKLQAAKFTH